MEIYDYTVEKEESGIRIDRYLAEKDSGLSRSFLQKLLKEGQITVGEKAAKSNYKVRENDRIHLEIPGIIREHWSMQLWHIVVTAFPVLTE